VKSAGLKPGNQKAACAALLVRTFDLSDGDVGAEVDVLDGVEELDAFGHGALEGFAAGD